MKQRFGLFLLGELSSQDVVQARIEPHRAHTRPRRARSGGTLTACLSLLREPNARRHDGEIIEPAAKQAAEIAAI